MGKVYKVGGAIMTLCKSCGSSSVESTCVGVIGGSDQDRYDANRHTCSDCGHVTPRKEESVTLPAGPELDRLIAEKVMGWEQDGLGYSIDGGKDYRHPFEPSANIAHAWEVLDRMSELKFCYGISGPKNSAALCMCHIATDKRTFSGYGDTAPLAICRAALAGVGK